MTVILRLPEFYFLSSSFFGKRSCNKFWPPDNFAVEEMYVPEEISTFNLAVMISSSILHPFFVIA